MEETNNKRIKKLMEKYNYRTYVYAEYPHKSYWTKEFSEDMYKKALLLLGSEKKDSPLMFYVHIPFCKMQCFYCTCHTSITNDYQKIKDYLVSLYKEIDLLKDFFTKNSIKPNFKEIHIGGGSPTLLKEEEFDILIKNIRDFVELSEIREFSLEIDPRTIDNEKLRYYSSKGINRISFGIQDFEPDVQKAINRVQPFEIVEKLMTPEIRNLFSHGINFDILCGLPNQTIESIKRTFKKIIHLAPDRVCFSYLGFFPEYAKHQHIMIDGKNGRPDRLPDEYERRILFMTGVEILLSNGYIRTGYDHFVKITDEIAESLKKGKMRWNALGITTGDYTDVLAVGASSTNTLGRYYSQNLYYNEGYIEVVNKLKLPVYRGYVLNEDEMIRREVIQAIRNYGKIKYNEIGTKLNIEFKKYFKKELEGLEGFEKDGLLIKDEEGFEMTELGREFVLFVCGNFDSFLNAKRTQLTQEDD